MVNRLEVAMLSTHQLHQDVVEYCCHLAEHGLTWDQIDASVWMRYRLYAFSYALELHEWVDEAKSKVYRLRA
jgi:hypothetical protein